MTYSFEENSVPSSCLAHQLGKWHLTFINHVLRKEDTLNTTGSMCGKISKKIVRFGRGLNTPSSIRAVLSIVGCRVTGMGGGRAQLLRL